MALSNAERQALHRERRKAQSLEEMDREIYNLRKVLHKYIDSLSETGLYAISPLLFWAVNDLNDEARQRVKIKSDKYFLDIEFLNEILNEHFEEEKEYQGGSAGLLEDAHIYLTERDRKDIEKIISDI
ncbi:MAG: hypothetical protein FWG77_10755 [Treponema sp.]|nr:hypothetical protein [Treponema sp.]